MTSQLQKLSSSTAWTINFRLHKLPTVLINDLALSPRSTKLLTEYNNLTDELKSSIALDYLHNKSRILRTRRIDKHRNSTTSLILPK